MQCPELDKTIAFLDGDIQDAAEVQRIESHISSCADCKEMRTMHTALRQAGDDIQQIGDINIPEFQMTPELRRAISQQAAEAFSRGLEARQRPFSRFLDNVSRIFQQPVWAGVAAIVLIAVGAIFVAPKILGGDLPHTTSAIAGTAYHVWGDATLAEPLQDLDSPPALQVPEIRRHLGFLTPKLVEVLRQSQHGENIWQTLTEALNRQQIVMPESLETLAIEASLFSALQSEQVEPNQKVWVLFYRDKVVLFRTVSE